LRAAEDGVGGRHRLDAALQGGHQFIDSNARFLRAINQHVHARENVLHAMIELGSEMA
jgi:hypothetical protein